MSDHDACLNIHYSAPDEIWDKINEVYRSMEYYCKGEDCLTWQGQDIELYSSVEPGGIQISGEMPDEIWAKWYHELRIIFESTGLFAGKKQRQEFSEFMSKLADLGINTLDLT